MSEAVNSCPICYSDGSTVFMELKDHFLSGELFTIRQCGSCGFRYISPRPGKEEIARYYQSEDYISHDAGKSDLLSRIYKLARKYSIRNKYRTVAKYSRKGTLLDIGCGTGEFLAYCRSNGYEISGVEPNEKARSFAGGVNGVPAVENLSSLGVPDDSFDCITLWHVMEHIHDLDETIGRIRAMLKPGGTLIVAVPNSDSWDAARYGTHWAAYDVPRHLYHFTRPTMELFAGRNGFRVAKVLPQKLDSYYVSMLSEKYLHGKTSWLRFVINGFLSNLMAGMKGRGHSSLIFIMYSEKR